MKTILQQSLLIAVFALMAFIGNAQDECYINGPEFIPCPTYQVYYEVICSDSFSFYYVTDWSLAGPNGIGYVSPLEERSVIVNLETPGSYILTGIVTKENGSTETLRLSIYVGEEVSIAIEGCYEELDDCLLVCEGSSNNFIIADSTGNNPNFSWYVNGAERSNLIWNGIEIDWGDPGTATVEYEGACGLGSYCIRILAEPIADFEVEAYPNSDTLTVCRNEILTFKNQSENALSQSWNFGDGNTSNAFEPVHHFENSGVYTVQLSTFGVCTCADEKEIIVNVLDAAAPTLDCIHTVCPDTRQVYTATTDGCQEFHWEISNNGTIIRGGNLDDDFIEVIWHSGPDGMIELSVSNCNSDYCSSVAQFRVPVISPEGPLEGDLSVCSGELVRYTLPDFPGAEYQWNLSGNGSIVGDTDRNTITILWDEVTSASTATLRGDYNHCFLGCGGSDEIEVNITPNVQLIADQQVCQGEVAVAQAVSGFSATSPVAVDWELQDESGSVLLSLPSSTSFNTTFNYPPGIYYWVAYNSSPNYCNESTRAIIEIIDTPKAPSGVEGETQICSNIEYGYTVLPGGNYATEWIVTDGSNTFNYSGSNIRHQFGNAAPYAIEVYHTDLQNPSCSSPSYLLPIENGMSNDIAGSEDVCHESIERYTMTMINGAQYDWSIVPNDMGDLLKTNSNEIEIFWTQPGNATLVLEACGTIIQKEIYIQANPTFNILGDLSTCGNVRTTLTTDQPQYQHQWKDENNLTLSTSSSVDLLPGFYSVELIDPLGCSSRQPFEISGLPFPEVNLTSPTPIVDCAQISSQGVQLVTNTDGVDYTFEWFQNGSSVGSGPLYTANTIAEYYVEATNEFGCSTASIILNLQDLCNSNGGSGGPGGCTYLPDNFNLNVQENSCSSKTYSNTSGTFLPGTERWTIRSISEAYVAGHSGATFNHEYQLPGYYLVVFGGELDTYLYPDTICGHSDYFIDTVLMVADFVATEACANTPLSFNDLSTMLPGQQIVSWQWDFGDPASGANNQSNLQNSDHTFATAGTYQVTLTTTALNGCTSQRVRTIEVHEAPDLTIDHDPLSCENVSASFEVSGKLFDVLWNFGDLVSVENSATEQRVFHEYSLANTYNVSVEAVNVYGCWADENTSIDVFPNTLNGTISASPGLEICEGNTIQLNAPPVGDAWQWSTGETDQNIRVTSSDQYGLFITDQYNCQYEPPSVFVNILPKPIVTVRGRRILANGEVSPWQDSLLLCEGESFELQAFSRSGLTYDWNNGETTTSLIFDDVSLDLPSPGVQEYSVIATDLVNSCESDAFVFRVNIREKPSVPQIIVSSGSLCAYDLNVLEVIAPDPNIEYVWSNGTMGTSITVTDAGEYFVYAINNNGCHTESNTLTINPAARMDLIPAGCFDLCDPYLLCLPDIGPISQYQLTRDGIVVASGNSWPNDYLLDQDGSYVFEVSTPNGCTVSSDPLDIRLFPGIGTITTEVYVDVDGDGLISSSDTLISGIEVLLSTPSIAIERRASTQSSGTFDFTDLPVDDYLGHIDQNLLHPRWTILMDSIQETLVDCDDTQVIQLLIGENCIVQGPPIDFEVCSGTSFNYLDSTWISPGQFEYHHKSAAGCDSIEIVELLEPDSLYLVFQTWFDYDNDGVVSASDTLLTNVDITINDGSGNLLGSINTGSNGTLGIPYLRGDYDIILDSTMLSPEYLEIIGLINVDNSDCDTLYLDFLVGDQCLNQELFESATVCEGDSIQFYGTWFSKVGRDSALINRSGGYCDTLLIVDLTWAKDSLSAQSIVQHACEQSGSLGSIEFTVWGAEPFEYAWEPAVSNNSYATDLVPGTYKITISDQYGCQRSETIDILAQDSLSFSIPALYEVFENTSKQLFILGDTSLSHLQVNWNPADYLDCSDCFSPRVTPLDDQDYIITITDGNGCPYSLFTRVELISVEDSLSNLIFSPTVFSPNNDNMNDRFKLYSKEEVTVVSFSVFNRWGSIVYEENGVEIDLMSGWDGSYNGLNLNSNVFIYQAILRTKDGKSFNQSGDVTLLK